MLTCSRCGGEFDPQLNPGALLFGHPDTLGEGASVSKAQLCQQCERTITADWRHKPSKASPPEPVPASYAQAYPMAVAGDVPFVGVHYGLTKREYFAGQALAGLLANSRVSHSHEDVARDSVSLADHLMHRLTR